MIDRPPWRQSFDSSQFKMEWKDLPVCYYTISREEERLSLTSYGCRNLSKLLHREGLIVLS